MSHLRTLADSSEYVTERPKRTVYEIHLPKGAGSIGLTAQEVVSATIEPHGNTGRSRVRFTLQVEVQAEGTPEQLRREIARALVADIERLEEELHRAKNPPVVVEDPVVFRTGGK